MATNNSTDTSNPMTVTQGGTGKSLFSVPYGVIIGGTTNTGALQTVASLGSAGQVLTSQGAALPIWAASAGGGGAWVLISSQTASNSANISFTSGISGTYDNYFFILSSVIPATNGANLQMQVSTNGGSTYVNSGYLTGCNSSAYTSSTLSNANSTTACLVTPTISSTANYGTSGTLNCYNVTNGKNCSFNGLFSYYDSSLGQGSVCAQGGLVGTTTINAFKFTMSSGNIASGIFSLFGILE